MPSNNPYLTLISPLSDINLDLHLHGVSVSVSVSVSAFQQVGVTFDQYSYKKISLRMQTKNRDIAQALDKVLVNIQKE